MFHMLCRIKLFSNVHRTEIVLVMGRDVIDVIAIAEKTCSLVTPSAGPGPGRN